MDRHSLQKKSLSFSNSLYQNLQILFILKQTYLNKIQSLQKNNQNQHKSCEIYNSQYSNLKNNYQDFQQLYDYFLIPYLEKIIHSLPLHLLKQLDMCSIITMQFVKQLFYTVDLFAVVQFFRYKGKPNSRTLTGGFISILVLTLIAVLCVTKIIVVFQKSQITVTQTTSQQTSLSPLKFSSNFMLGVSSANTNLNNQTYFIDITFLDGNQEYLMEPCTPNHWKSLPNFQSVFLQKSISQWKCLPLNKSFSPLPGSSIGYQLLVKRCDVSNASDSKCNSDDQSFLEYLDQQILTLNILNIGINPGSEAYIMNYMQSSNTIILGKSQVIQSQIDFSDFSIDSDTSLFLFSSKIIDNGLALASSIRLISCKPKSDANNTQSTSPYGIINIGHSSQKTNYIRKYFKIDDVLSYIGGLFNTLLAICAITKFYSEEAYECLVGSRLFFNKPILSNTQEKLRRYNILFLIKEKFQQLFRVNRQINFTQIQKRIRQELDVVYLYQRINFLERLVSVLYEQHQLNAMMIYSYVTLQDMERKRKKLQISSEYEQQIQKKVIINEKRNKGQFDSSDLGSSQSKQSENKDYSKEEKIHQFKNVIYDLRQLKGEADQGNKKSKTIWDLLIKQTIKLMKHQRLRQNPLEALYNDIHDQDVEQATQILLDIEDARIIASAAFIRPDQNI